MPPYDRSQRPEEQVAELREENKKLKEAIKRLKAKVAEKQRESDHWYEKYCEVCESS